MKSKYVLGFWVWIVIMTLAMLAMGCSTEYYKGWSWGMVTEDGIETAKIIWENKDVHVSSVNKHDTCRKRHYIDPYSKFEYCLPEAFWDAPASYNIKNYRMKRN